MLPTFDFSNLIRKIVFSAGWSFINPVTFTVAFAISVGSIISLICSKLGYFLIPNLSPSLSLPSSSLWELVCYSLALDHLVSVIDAVINFLNLIIPFVCSAVPSFVGACFLFRSSSVIRKAWLSLVTK